MSRKGYYMYYLKIITEYNKNKIYFTMFERENITILKMKLSNLLKML